MTEQEWLTSEDPVAMLQYAKHPDPTGLTAQPVAFSDRKLRLFAAGCTRLSWAKLTDHRSRRVVEVAERYADGLATAAELAAARDGGQTATWAAGRDGGRDGGRAAARDAAWTAVRDAALAAGWAAARAVDPPVRCGVLCCVFGNPWRPVTLCGEPVAPLPGEECDACERLRTPTVLALARAAYEVHEGQPCGRCGGEGLVGKSVRAQAYDLGGVKCPDCGGSGRVGGGLLDSHRLAVLADALEEVGCSGQDCPQCEGRGDGLVNGTMETTCFGCDGKGRLPHPLLAHLRSPGPHVRGCWALDLTLGKE